MEVPAARQASGLAHDPEARERRIGQPPAARRHLRIAGVPIGGLPLHPLAVERLGLVEVGTAPQHERAVVGDGPLRGVAPEPEEAAVVRLPGSDRMRAVLRVARMPAPLVTMRRRGARGSRTDRPQFPHRGKTEASPGLGGEPLAELLRRLGRDADRGIPRVPEAAIHGDVRLARSRDRVGLGRPGLPVTTEDEGVEQLPRDLGAADPQADLGGVVEPAEQVDAERRARHRHLQRLAIARRR